MNQTHTLHVSGMHCASCIILTEEALGAVSGVVSTKADLARHIVVVTGNLPESAAEAAALLTPHMPAGYSLSAEVSKRTVKWHEFLYAIPVAALLFAGFIALQKTGLVEVSAASGMNLGVAIVIGLVASVSTCLAIVGGLVLSVSAAYAKTGNTIKPQLYFHLGRLASFFILGGLLGLLGKSMQLGATGNLILTIAVGIIMLILGINLLDIFHSSGKLQLHLPKQFSARIHSLKNSTHAAMPLALGAATFFLPCGFTQSMQTYALSTGSFTTGALTMLVFALGTLPMLALLSFGSFSINNKPWRGIFFKTAGAVVIALATINILNALAVSGIIDPIF